MSPILVRPVREQFEHDRVIRVLQQRYRRKFEVAINPGSEQNTPVGNDSAIYPDLVLFSQERGRKLLGTVEVETGESINMLEAMAEWGPYSRLRAPFYLYVPPNAIDTVRRLCLDHQVDVAEIWTYHTAVDQIRFTLVHRAPETAKPRAADKTEKKAEPARTTRTTAKAPAAARARKAAAPAKSAAAKKSAKPARAAKRAAPARKTAKSSGTRAVAKRR